MAHRRLFFTYALEILEHELHVIACISKVAQIKTVDGTLIS